MTHRPPEPTLCVTSPWRWRWLAGLAVVMVMAAWPCITHGQVGGVTINAQALRVGLGEKLTPGQWTPLQVSLDNTLPRPLTVRVELLVPDADGDIARHQRRVTLTPQRRDQRAWVYAVAPADLADQRPWRLQVIDDDTGQMLAHHDIPLGARALDPHQAVVGVIGQATMGLEPYASAITQQQAVHFLRGLEPGALPDRWQGLSMCSSLIWTPRHIPTDSAAPPEAWRALRHWILRGGHLVIVLPIAGDTWDQSPLADLLPAADSQVIHGVLPLFLGALTTLPTDDQRISLRVFSPPAGAGQSVPANGDAANPSGQRVGDSLAAWGDVTPVLSHEGRPWVIAHQVGVGRVTLVGADLTDPRLVRLGLPSPGRWTLWNDVFGWRGPALGATYLQAEIDAGRINRPDLRDPLLADDFIRQRIALSGTAGAAILLALGLFTTYWLVAGPLCNRLLRRVGKAWLTWQAFALVALAATAIAWGGAWLMKPRQLHVRHLSVLTGTMGKPDTHVRAWLSLHVPWHGDAAITLMTPDTPATPDTPHASPAGRDAIWSVDLASPGQAAPAYPDRRQYSLPSADADAITLPFRATPRELALDHLGALPPPTPTVASAATSRPGQRDAASSPSPTPSWQPPTGSIRLVDGWPVGHLTHQLPGELKHVAILYHDGRPMPNGQLREPFYWLYRDPWPADRPLMLTGRPANVQFLLQGSDPQWSGRLLDLTRRFSNDAIDERIEILTLYDMLPPPDYRDMRFMSPVRVYRRRVGRVLDLTPLARLRCLVILGRLTDAPLPAPLQVDRQTPTSQGDVLVRWIIPLP